MQNVCKNCGISFEIPEEDLAFYQKISPKFGDKTYLIPPPTFCVDCRLQRRTAWRNERALYQRNCGKCSNKIISIFSPDKPNAVYCNQCWWGDNWNALNFGKDYDFDRPFFEQFQELMRAVPQLAIQNDDGVGSTNCAYCQDFAQGKNCYFAVGSWYVENAYYSSYVVNDRYICDCTDISGSELAYECTDSEKLYNCIFLQNCNNCSDCKFGFDLKGCKNCLACFGLRQKEYHIFNKPYSKEDYQKELQKYNFDSYAVLDDFRKKFAEWSKKFPRKHMTFQMSENCVGNYLYKCNTCTGFCLSGSDHSKYCVHGDTNIYCHDIYNGGKMELCYEGVTLDNSYLAAFSWFCWKCKSALYSLNCHSCENIFGCIALHRAKYCILNKQYTKEEYEALMPKIIEQMQKNGEWGEAFPASISYFGYNETIAQDFFPLKKEEALAKKYQWKDQDPKEYKPQQYQIPDKTSEVPAEIIQEVLACTNCGKNFKIIQQELELYKKLKIAVPRKCPDCRHRERLALRPAYKLWNRTCVKCSAPIQTSYAPDRPEPVYCEKCYPA